MDRMNNPIDALLATEEIYAIFLRALHEEEERAGANKGKLASIRGGKRPMSNDTDITLKLERALTIHDRAMISLHLSYTASLADEQEVEARHALMDFKVACAILDKSDEKTKSSEEWQEWYQEVQEGLHAANERLAELDVLP